MTKPIAMALNNGWIRIDTVSGSGNAAVSVVVLEKNTGRSVTRTETLVGINAHDVEATATIKQDPMPLFLTIDRIETYETGSDTPTVMDTLPSAAGNYNIVGYANVGMLSARETSEKEYTDLNQEQALARVYGAVIIDGGTLHSDIPLDTEFSYGEARQYEFLIPFYATENQTTSERAISLEVSDGDDIIRTIQITQEATL